MWIFLYGTLEHVKSLITFHSADIGMLVGLPFYLSLSLYLSTFFVLHRFFRLLFEFFFLRCAAAAAVWLWFAFYRFERKKEKKIRKISRETVSLLADIKWKRIFIAFIWKQMLETETIYALKFLPSCRIHTNTHILNRHVFQMKITRTIAKSLRTERPRIGSLI